MGQPVFISGRESGSLWRSRQSAANRALNLGRLLPQVLIAKEIGPQGPQGK